LTDEHDGVDAGDERTQLGQPNAANYQDWEGGEVEQTDDSHGEPDLPTTRRRVEQP
jgi:hypothetical protein